MAKRRSETTENQGMRAPKSSVLESLSLRNSPAIPREISNGGFARLKKRLKMKEYSEPRIYFGCAAIKQGGEYLPEKLQPKSLSNEWYITWNHFHPALGKKRQVRWRLGMNYMHTLEERIEEAHNALLEVRRYLDEGNNPWIEEAKAIELLPALDKAFEFWKNKKTRATQTYYDYRNALNAFKESCKEYQSWPVKDIKRVQVREVLDKIQSIREIGNTRYNFIKGVIRTLFSDMIELGYIEVNPLADMQGKKKEKPEAHQTFTAEEKKRIRDAFAGDPFYLMPMLTYYAGIRPGEQRKLLVEDIDLDTDIIFLEGKKTKSANARVAIIPPPLKGLISKHIKGADPKWYVFGNEDFSPSGKQLAEKRQSKYWLKVVKVGLEIDKNMYGLKHTAGDDLLDVDVSENLIKELYGHTSVRMTKKYLTRQKQSAFRQISEKIKEFGT